MRNFFPLENEQETEKKQFIFALKKSIIFFKANFGWFYDDNEHERKGFRRHYLN